LASLINNNETLPIRAVVVTGKNTVGLRVEEHASVTSGETTARRVHRYCEELVVSGKIKEFLTIPPPEWAAPVAAGNLPLPSRSGKRHHVDSVLA